MLAVLADHHHFFRGGFEHHRRQHIAIVGVFFQSVIDGIVHLFGVDWQVDELFRTPVNLAALKIHDALAQSFVSGHLLVRLHRGVNVQTAGVGVLAILRINHLANGLGHVFGMQNFLVRCRSQLEWLSLSRFGLSRCDVLVVFHPLNDVELA